MALNIVELPYSYFPDFSRGRALWNAQIFVGVVDTDPEIPANQKQVTVRQEDGTEVQIAQPVRTSSGGVPTYNGSPVTVLVDGAYSIKVLDRLGGDEYYSPDVTKGVPLTPESLPTYTDLVFDSVADMISDESLTLDTKVRTKQFNTQCVSDWVIVSSGAGDMTDGTVQLNNGLYAQLQKDDAHTIAHYGAYNDGATNDFDAMSAMESNTGRIKLVYRGDHILQGTLSFAAGTQRKDINFNHAKVKLGAIAGDYLFVINGSATVQSFLNFIHSGQVDLAGAKGLVNWNSGSFTSGLRDIYIFDSTNDPDVVAVRSFNSFNMVFDNFRTSGSLGGTHLLLEADNGVSGFPNLTNIKLKDSILQTNQDDATLIKILLGASAADTISLENVALKSNVAATNNVSLDVDGFINCLEMSNLHLETSNEVFRTASGKTINAHIHDCLITDCGTTFNWGASGWISGNNNRWVNGAGTIAGKEVFTLLNADFTQNGAFLVDTGNYDADIKSGTGTFRREKDEVTPIVGTRNASRVDDSRIYVNKTSGSTINLPKSSEVKAGFKQGLMTRTGTNRFQCQDGDRILGVSGTTADGGIQTGGTGNYAEVTCQNDDGGNKFWQVTSLVGSWVGD